MDAYFERLIASAATIAEILSDDFETGPSSARDQDLAARRIEAWRRSAAGGDRGLFARRLARDGWETEQVLARFTSAHRKPTAAAPAWIGDAVWIVDAIQGPAAPRGDAEPLAFDDLLVTVAAEADPQLWSEIDAHVAAHLARSARADLCHSLVKQLSELAAPTLYERFSSARKGEGVGYAEFIAGMRPG